LDSSIAESVSSLLWVAPHIQADVSEMKVISDQLTQKFGKKYTEVNIIYNNHNDLLNYTHNCVQNSIKLFMSPIPPPQGCHVQGGSEAAAPHKLDKTELSPHGSRITKKKNQYL